MSITDDAADLGGRLDYDGRPAVFDRTAVCSADDAADLVVCEHFARYAEVPDRTAPALTEQTRHVDKVRHDVKSAYRVAAAVKISSEICYGLYALMVIERCSDRHPARTLDIYALSCDVYIIRQVEVCILCRVALLNIL